MDKISSEKSCYTKRNAQYFFHPQTNHELACNDSLYEWRLSTCRKNGSGINGSREKGYIKKTEENHFKMENRLEKPLKHERILLDFLFKKVGSNGEFSFDDLSKYTKQVTNHAKYQTNQFNWGTKQFN